MPPWWPYAATASAVGLLVSGQVSGNWSGWASDVLFWVSITFLLTLPLWRINSTFDSMQKRLDHTDREISDTRADTEGVRTELKVRDRREDTTSDETPLEAVDRQLRAGQVAAMERALAPIEQWIKEGSRASTADMLRAHIDSGLIDSGGLRAPVWETDLHFCFALRHEEPFVAIESNGRKVVGSVSWTKDIDTLTMFEHLEAIVREQDGYLGANLFSPAEAIRTAGEALTFARIYSEQRLQHGAEHFRNIIEYVDGWFITAAGMMPREHPNYFIKAGRLNEPDWEEQISRKGWESIHSAISVARAIHGTRKLSP